MTVIVGAPILPRPGQTVAEINEMLRSSMGEMLDTAQRDYPDRPRRLRDSWWMPRHLGGSAPDPARAALLDAAAIRV